jgi:putative sigma-54 modulation protein
MSALQIQFQDTAQTPAVVERIESKYQRLERLCGTILSCRVVVSQPHRHQRKGRQYCVSIELKEPKKTYVAQTEANRPEHEDVFAAIRECFDAAARQVHEEHRRRREQQRVA